MKMTIMLIQTEVVSNKEIKDGVNLRKMDGTKEIKAGIIHIKIRITTQMLMEIEVALRHHRHHVEEMLSWCHRRLPTAHL